MGNFLALLLVAAIFGLALFSVALLVAYRNDEHWARRIVQLYRNSTHPECRKGVHDMERDEYRFYEFDEDVWYCSRCGHCEVRSLDVTKSKSAAVSQLEAKHG